MIKTVELTKKYSKLVAVDHVSLGIGSGQCFALLGLNGAGKSTFFGMLSTSILPSFGTASIEGFDVVKDRREVRKIVNISPQESAVAKNLTVRENLSLIADLYSVPNRREKIAELIERLGLSEKQDTLCKRLSGGQLRRVSIALALVTSPKILFLDEPTLGLDIKARSALWEIVLALKKEMTVLLTTHYLEEAEALADEIAVISRGKIKAVGTRDEICKIANCETLEQAFLRLTEEET